MTTVQKKLTFGSIFLVASVLLFAQARPTGFRSIKIACPGSINSCSDVPLEIDLKNGQAAVNAITVKNAAGANVFTVGATGAGQLSATPFTHVYDGAGAPAISTTGTDTTGVANTIWVSELDLDTTIAMTGIQYLVGSVGGTDKAIAILYDSAGNVLANSALAGTTVGTLATLQSLAFTAPYTAVGPGLYFVGIQTNGTTAHLRTAAFGGKFAGTITGQTFGTPTAITPPATFTASTAPIAMTY